MLVDRCICHDVTFAALRELHEREGCGLDALKDRTGCCTGCTMCEPYVKLMLKTGRTRFNVLTPHEVWTIMRE